MVRKQDSGDSSSKMKMFEVGDQATIVMYSDRIAGRIISVSKSGKKVMWQEDTHILVKAPTATPGGFSAHFNNNEQLWDNYPNPDGNTRVFSLRKNDKFVQKHLPMNGSYLIKGDHHFHDYNF